MTTTPKLRAVVGLLQLACSSRDERRRAWAALEALEINLDAAMRLGRAIHAEDGERWSVIAEEWCEWRASRSSRPDALSNGPEASPPMAAAHVESASGRRRSAQPWGSER